MQTFAQLSEGGKPVTFKWDIDWDEIPAFSLPYIATEPLLQEDAINQSIGKNKMLRYGVAKSVNLNIRNSGHWRKIPNGTYVWMLRIVSKDAFSLSLGFKSIAFTEQSKLFIYNKDHSALLGAFTAKQHFDNNQLATEQVNGDELVVVYEMQDTNNIGTIPFVIERISHDYRGLGIVQRTAQKGTGFGDAGSCQVNINCPIGIAYQDVKKSVMLILANGTHLATGALVNTTNNSGIPYVLTAHHVYDANNSVGSWVFRFNWESANCTNPTSAPSTSYSISGASLIAKNILSDFCLVKLNSTPPASYGVVYAGWDKRNIAAATQACIHHPVGDLKKITLSSLSARDTINNYYWRSGQWTTGSLEPGSSGAPLFNTNLKIVGQVFGGPSSCGASAAQLWDIFGKFSRSWDNGTVSTERLKDWLDPNNSGADTLDFFDPNRKTYNIAINSIPSPVARVCNTQQTPVVAVENKGIDVITTLAFTVAIDGNFVYTYQWTGSLPATASQTITLPNIRSTAGAHLLKVSVTAPNSGTDIDSSNNSLVKSYEIVQPIAVTLPLNEGFESASFPNNGWQIINPNPGTYTWKRVANVAASGNASLRKDNFNQPDSGQVDYLYTPYLNFAADATYILSFKVAYARFNINNPDSLLVLVSSDCGYSWQQVYGKTGRQLATAPDTTYAFFPNPMQWRTDSVDLSAFKHVQALQVAFVNISGYGNHIYLDDVNIEHFNALPVSDFELSDTLCIGTSYVLQNKSIGADTYIWQMTGATPAISTQVSPTIVYNNTGVYSISLRATNAIGSELMTKNILVVPPPSPVIGETAGVLYTGNYASYQWYRNGIAISGATQQTYSYTIKGNYTVEVATSYNCSGKSPVYRVYNSSVDDKSLLGGQINIFPSPATSFLKIVYLLSDGKTVQLSLYNMLGAQVLSTSQIASGEQIISLPQLATGIYTLRVEKDGVVAHKTIAIR